MSYIANTPETPYYAVIFTSQRTDGDNGYAEIAEKMVLIFQSPNSQGRA